MTPQTGQKFINIFLKLLIGVVAFIVIAAILFFAAKYSSAAFDALPWSSGIYAVIIILVPPAIYAASAYFLWRRAKAHNNKSVVIFSKIAYLVIFAACIAVVGRDILEFVKTQSPDTKFYWSYTLWFLVGGFVWLFFTTFIRAATTPKEMDWMEKRSLQERKSH